MADFKGHRLILGSNSPRRRELLAGLDLDFTIDTGNTFEEFIDPTIPSEMIPVEMARGKSLGFHRSLEDDEILITADTLVLCDSQVMGKPHDREDARRMLRLLSGKDHKVITGVCLRSANGCKWFADTSLVHFRRLTDEEIDYYIDTCKPYDKAGAYGIQEWIGYVGISWICGSFYNIMGLPVEMLWVELNKFASNG